MGPGKMVSASSLGGWLLMEPTSTPSSKSGTANGTVATCKLLSEGLGEAMASGVQAKKVERALAKEMAGKVGSRAAAAALTIF